MQRMSVAIGAAANEEEQRLCERSEELGKPSAAAAASSRAHCKSICVAFAYTVASVVTTLANKALLTSYSFDYVLSLLLMQNVLTVVVVSVAHIAVHGRGGSGSGGGGGAAAAAATSALAEQLSFPLWNTRTAMAMLPVMVMCSANLWAGMSALRLSSVPVYQTLKRMTPLPAMALDYLLRGKTFTGATCCSVLVVCLGAFVTGCGDLDYNQRGYAFAMASCVLQALYLVLASRARDARPEITSLCAAHYNALLSLPLLAPGVMYEWEGLRSFPSWGEAEFLGLLVADLCLGASLSLLLFMCTLTNSALTTTIVGNAKAVVTTALGAALFSSASKGLKPLGWVGICVNTAGGIMYTAAKYHESAARAGRK